MTPLTAEEIAELHGELDELSWLLEPEHAEQASTLDSRINILIAFRLLDEVERSRSKYFHMRAALATGDLTRCPNCRASFIGREGEPGVELKTSSPMLCGACGEAVAAYSGRDIPALLRFERTARALLKRIEWAGDREPAARCPACWNVQPGNEAADPDDLRGHADGCELAALLAGDSAATPAKVWVACDGWDDDQPPVAVYLDKDSVATIEKSQADAMSAWRVRNEAWQAEWRKAERSEQRLGGAAHNERWRKEHPWEPPPQQLTFHCVPVNKL